MSARVYQLLMGVALLLALLAGYQGGSPLVWAGIRQALLEISRVLPLLAVAFLVAGFIQALVTQEFVTRWLGREAGWKGIVLASVGGALVPGGPYVYYPIAAVLLRSGAGLGVLVAFVTAKNVWSISRLPIEFALLGPYLTLVRLGVTALIPPVMGAMAEFIAGDWVHRMREVMEQ